MPTSLTLPIKSPTSSPLKTLLFLFTTTTLLYLLLLHHPTSEASSPSSSLIYHHAPSPTIPQATTTTSKTSTITTMRRHIAFSIASSARSFPSRAPFIRLWYDPSSTKALVFLDRELPSDQLSGGPSLPRAIISGDTSNFPYTFPKGLRSAVRVARIVKEAVEKHNNTAEIRWFVFGDDDTVFVVDNLVSVLAKYDHDRWFYIGSGSEIYEQNFKHGFDMAFGGGGFAISCALARVLARVLDSCLLRYGHLYGSDSRVYACLAELGVGLTREPGFHQVDIRGNLFGLLSAHPLSPLLSIHHLQYVDPIFPNMDRIQSLQRLFQAVDIDPSRALQQIVCYDRSTESTISISWGYAVQVYEGIQLLPDLLSLEKTFRPWTRSANPDANHYMFKTREFLKDPCRRPAIFFLENITSEKNGVWSNYTSHNVENCSKSNLRKSVELIKVFSQKLDPDIEELKAPRRQCCDVLPSSDHSMSMVINVRHCGVDELISVQTQH